MKSPVRKPKPTDPPPSAPARRKRTKRVYRSGFSAADLNCLKPGNYAGRDTLAAENALTVAWKALEIVECDVTTSDLAAHLAIQSKAERIVQLFETANEFLTDVISKARSRMNGEVKEVSNIVVPVVRRRR